MIQAITRKIHIHNKMVHIHLIHSLTPNINHQMLIINSHQIISNHQIINSQIISNHQTINNPQTISNRQIISNHQIIIINHQPIINNQVQNLLLMAPVHIIEPMNAQLDSHSTIVSLVALLMILDAVKHVQGFVMQDTNLFLVEQSNATVIVVLEDVPHAVHAGVWKFQQAKLNFMINTLSSNRFHSAHTSRQAEEWSTSHSIHVLLVVLMKAPASAKVVQEFVITDMMFDLLVWLLVSAIVEQETCLECAGVWTELHVIIIIIVTMNMMK